MFDTVLSEFDPPPENPLYEDGAWAQLTPEREPLQKGTGLATNTTFGNPDYSYYTQKVFRTGAPIEVFGCSQGGQLGAALESWRIGLWTLETAGTFGAKGYVIVQGGSISKDTIIRRYDGGGQADFTGIGGLGNTGYPDKLGIRINGSQIEAWHYSTGAWHLVTTATDTTYRGAFVGGIGLEDPTGGGLFYSCFGGNVRNRTQIYRVVKGL